MPHKGAIAFMLAVTMSPSTLAAQPSVADHLIVPGVAIGSAELESADQGSLTRQLGQPGQTQRRGDHEYYFYGPAADPDGLVVDFDLANDVPFEISTSSPAYRTREGLGVGSSATAIRSALGPPLCEGRDDKGGGLIVYDSIWFLTAGGNVTKLAIRKHLSPSDFRTGALHC